jgi:hypothetical protein
MTLINHGMTQLIRSTAGNSTYKKLAVQCSADTYAINLSLVLRIDICGENRQLLVAENRYGQVYEKTTKRKTTDKRTAKE